MEINSKFTVLEVKSCGPTNSVSSIIEAEKQIIELQDKFAFTEFKLTISKPCITKTFDGDLVYARVCATKGLGTIFAKILTYLIVIVASPEEKKRLLQKSKKAKQQAKSDAQIEDLLAFMEVDTDDTQSTDLSCEFGNNES